MKINKAYIVELRPNKVQANALARSAGCARFAYNWGLSRRIELYKSDKKSLTAIDQHKELCLLKKDNFPWMYESTKCAPQEALRDLDRAFKNFFRGIKSGIKVGYPKFKKKNIDDSFRISTGAVHITKNTIKLPNIKSPIRLKENNYIPIENVKYNSYTIKKEADKWYISVQVEEDIITPPPAPNEVVGVDLGIKTLATISDGTKFYNPKSLHKLERSLKRKQKEISRKKKGSRSRFKSVRDLQVKHKIVSNVRKDSIHKMTSTLVKTKPRVIVIEDLSVKNMLKNHKLAKSLSDAAFGEIRRQITYKSVWYGSELIIADRYFPSSKLCSSSSSSSCDSKKEDLSLSDRIYKCECGLSIDRDLNASINLKRYGEFHRSLYKNKAHGEERFQSYIPATAWMEDGAPHRSEKETASLTLC